MEIITGDDRRRRWRVKEKLQTVAECERPRDGSSLTRRKQWFVVELEMIYESRRTRQRPSIDTECNSTAMCGRDH
jgi:hypothetical protein